MPKKATGWQAQIPGFFLGLITGLIPSVVAIWQYLDSKRAHIVGYVANPLPELRVELDNGVQTQKVNQDSGYFRFESVIPGTHQLQFLHSTFVSHSRDIYIDGTDEHVLDPEIELPTSSDASTRVGESIRSIALLRSRDATEPLVMVASTQTSAQHVVDRAAFMTADAARGWIHVGSENSNEDWPIAEKVDAGATTEAVDLTVVRSRPPNKELFVRGYRLGELVGTIEAGQFVQVTGYAEINGELWAQVRQVDQPQK